MQSHHLENLRSVDAFTLPGIAQRVLFQRLLMPDSPTMTPEQGRAPLATSTALASTTSSPSSQDEALARYSLEEGMAIQSSTLVWRIPWTEEPGGLQSMGLQRVGRD